MKKIGNKPKIQRNQLIRKKELEENIGQDKFEREIKWMDAKCEYRN